VLINGQSGTGKELVAQALHKHSPRARQTFVALNMAAIPSELVESELFGHEKGAFTGAQNMRTGRFEQSDGGTLFLDEIGDMPVDVQTRLLRVLADGQFYRVGGHHPVSVDVRIIAATHQNLESRVADGSFREDLYHRLNVIKIHIPSLSERREDIPLLARHFLVKAAKELGVDLKSLSEEAAQKLASFSWPGNVRQLENTCRWLTVMASGQEIKPTDFPPELNENVQNVSTNKVEDDWTVLLAGWADQQLQTSKNDILDHALIEFERILLSRALLHTHGHKQDAAKRLGWGRNTLTRKLKELNIS
jgi:two-component system nitrogen regulation response regulator GlnG